MRLFRHPLLAATATVIGSSIGVGIFAIPYAVMKSGFSIGFLYMMAIGGMMLFTLLAYGEVVLRTSGKHQFTGYAQRYLGAPGRVLANISFIFGIYGALIAYLIEIANIIEGLVFGMSGWPKELYAVGFWCLAFFIIMAGLNALIRFEEFVTIGIMVLMLVVFFIGVSHVEAVNLATIHPQHFFFPYGVILFAFGSLACIPEIRNILVERHAAHKMPQALAFGIGGVTILYTVFTVMVVGISGEQTTTSAIAGLGSALGPIVAVVGSLFGIMAIGNAFITSGFVLQEMYRYDFHYPKFFALFVALLIPLVLYLLHVTNFIQMISIIGAVSGGAQGVLIFEMFLRAKRTGDREPEYTIRTIPALIRGIELVFLGGVCYELVNLFV
ncbi:MAG: hypothetical protein HYV32_04295 [Candidatus Kerfeldbacteria bacterium]|nr:hypothetical protein [Candidatus Kerfeldbacteria bacterium]